MLFYTSRAVATQLCALLLVISVAARPLPEEKHGAVSLLTPLRTSFVPFRSAIQLQPPAVLSPQKSWTVSKRFMLFVGGHVFTSLPDDGLREFHGIRPTLPAGVTTGHLARSPPRMNCPVSAAQAVGALNL